jgi:hypothetical protein
MLKTIDDLNELISEIKEQKSYIKKKDNIVSVYLQAMLFRGIHLAEEVVILVSKNRPQLTSLMARSLIEVFLDFVLLVKDPGYLLHMIDKNNFEKNRILKDLKAQGFEVEVEETPKWTNNKSIHNIRDKFDAIGLSDLYTIYRSFCSDTHNSTMSLKSSHVDYNHKDIVVLNKIQATNSSNIAINQSYKTLNRMFRIIEKYHSHKNSDSEASVM